MKLTSLDKVEKVKVDIEGAKNVFKQVPLSRVDGAPLFSFRVFTVEPNGNTPFHQHDFEHLIYILEGDGVAVGKDGNEIEIKKGDFIMVLPNEEHQLKNKSDSGQLVFICAVPKEYE